MKSLVSLMIMGILLTCLVSAIPSIQINQSFNYTSSSQYPIITLYSNISTQSVNSSDYWDNLDTPSDITGSEFWYNQSTGTFNMYGEWWINQSQATFDYNQTIGLYDIFEKFWYNHTSAVDLTPYWKSDGTSTATGDWNIGSYDFTTTGRINATQIKTDDVLGDTATAVLNLLPNGSQIYGLAVQISGNRLALDSIADTEISFGDDIVPYTSGQKDLGTSTYKWKDLNIEGDAEIQGETNTTDLRLPISTSTAGRIIQEDAGYTAPIFHTSVPTQQSPSYRNTFIGWLSGVTPDKLNNTVQPYFGTGNSALGAGTLQSLTTGFYNFAIGSESLKAVTTGNSNIGIGHQAGLSTTTGSNNIFIGRTAGGFTTTGSGNIGIGAYAFFITKGTDNTAIGNKAMFLAGNINRTIAIGAHAGEDETLSDRLIIDNRDRGNAQTTRTNAIVYGTMASAPTNQVYTINANVNVTQNLKVLGNINVTGCIEYNNGGVRATLGTCV